MGASVSLYEASQLPAIITRDKFYELTKDKFSSKAYDCYADRNGQVSKERFLEIMERVDCYLSFDWGIDDQGRTTYDRIKKINQFLIAKGLFTKLDEGYKIYKKSLNEHIIDELNHSSCVIIFLTGCYYKKLILKEKKLNQIQNEFHETMKRKDLKNIIPVILDESGRLIPEIIESQYPHFKLKPQLDMVDFEFNPQRKRDLYQYIQSTIILLRDGGNYDYHRFLYQTTTEGRHYSWLFTKIPSLGHEVSKKYAKIFTNASIESTFHLYQLLQHNDHYLVTRFDIDEEHERLIKLTLHKEIKLNFDSRNVKEINKVLKKQEESNKNKLLKDQELIKESKEQFIMNHELILMSKEDVISHNDRDNYFIEKSNNFFIKQRKKILKLCQQQHFEYETILNKLNIALLKKWNKEENNKRLQIFQSIIKMTEADELCRALQRLFIRLNIESNFYSFGETKLDFFEHALDDEYFDTMLCDPSGQGLYFNASIKQWRIQQLFHRTQSYDQQQQSQHQHQHEHDDHYTNKQLQQQQKYDDDHHTNKQLQQQQHEHDDDHHTNKQLQQQHEHDDHYTNKQHQQQQQYDDDHYTNKQHQQYDDDQNTNKQLQQQHEHDDHNTNKQQQVMRMEKNNVQNDESIEESSSDDDDDMNNDDSNITLHSHHNHYSRLVHLLQEAAYICRCITNLCLEKRAVEISIPKFLESGVVKLLNALLGFIYLFHCTFDSTSFLSKEFHILMIPNELLITIISLISCNGIGRRKINIKMGFLFVEGGLISNCIEIIKFHFNNLLIIKHSLSIINILMNIPELTFKIIKEILSDIHTLILLVILIETVGTTDLELQSLLINIMTHIIKSGLYDELLRSYRVFKMFPLVNQLILNTMNNNSHNSISHINIINNICSIIKNLYYEEAYVNNQYFTSEYLPQRSDYVSYMRQHVNSLNLLNFCSFVIHHYIKNDEIIIEVMIALGNLIFHHDNLKHECYLKGIPGLIVAILKHRLKKLDSAINIGLNSIRCIHNLENNTSSSTTTTMNSNVTGIDIEKNPVYTNPLIDITREVIHETLITAANLIILPSPVTIDVIDEDVIKVSNKKQSIIQEDIQEDFKDDVSSLNHRQMFLHPKLPSISISMKKDSVFIEKESDENIKKDEVDVEEELNQSFDTYHEGEHTMKHHTTSKDQRFFYATAQEIPEITTSTNIKNKNKAKNTVVFFVENGLCEMMMNFLSTYRGDRFLIYSVLIFLSRFIYRGRYITCKRLVTIRFYDQIPRLMKMYENDPEMYLLILFVTVGLVQSHPYLINANEKLIKATALNSKEQVIHRNRKMNLDETGVCESLSRHIHLHCPQREPGPKKWMHFNFPYICQTCLLHCSVAYFLMKDRIIGQEAYKKFRLANFYKGLMQAPGISSKELHLNIVPLSINAPEIERGESVDPRMKNTTQNIIVHAASFDCNRYRSASTIGRSESGQYYDHIDITNGNYERAIVLHPSNNIQSGEGLYANNTFNQEHLRRTYSREHLSIPRTPLVSGVDNRRGMLLLSADSCDSGDYSKWRGIYGTPSRSAIELQQLVSVPESSYFHDSAMKIDNNDEPRLRLPSTSIDMNLFHGSHSNLPPIGNSSATTAIPFRRPSIFQDDGIKTTSDVGIDNYPLSIPQHNVDVYRSKNQRRLQTEIYNSAGILESNHNDHNGMLSVGVFHEPLYVEYCKHAAVENIQIRRKEEVKVSNGSSSSMNNSQQHLQNDLTVYSTIADGSSIADEHSQIDDGETSSFRHQQCRSNTLVKDGYPGAIRNIEFPPPHLRAEKDMMMKALFKIFFIPS